MSKYFANNLRVCGGKSRSSGANTKLCRLIIGLDVLVKLLKIEPSSASLLSRRRDARRKLPVELIRVPLPIDGEFAGDFDLREAPP